MRRSPNTASSKKNPQDLSPFKSKSRSLTPGGHAQNQFYFCHYRNAMYMGGIKSFQRNGIGILLLDNGVSAVCRHYNDFKHGHNIVYGENCIMSIIYEKNKISECVFREANFLLYIRFKEGLPDGKAILMDYQNKGVIYATYRKGNIIQKSVLNRVFDLQNLQFLIGIPHTKAMRLQLEDNQNIQAQRGDSKVSIGFYKRGLLNGLAFSIVFREPGLNLDTHRSDQPFCLRALERGYYHNSHLSGMGEKWFKNDNVFEGRGVLKNSAKNNWVYGSFEKGNMSQLIEYSHEGDVIRSNKIIQAMHERKSTWINKQIHYESPETFMREICKIINSRANSHVKTLQERKQDVLKKIQENFICDNQNQSMLEQSRNIISYQQISADEKGSRPQELTNNFAVKYQQSKDSSFQSPKSKGHENIVFSPDAIEQEGYQSGERAAKPLYKIKLLEVPTTSGGDSSSRKRLASASPSKNIETSQKSMGLSQIQQESPSPSFKLESKRMVGRSRLFKYMPSEVEEEAPTFNYQK